MGKVVAGYRLSWSCMQLAYVSTGSFISPGGKSLSEFSQTIVTEPVSSSLVGERPNAAAMPEEEGFGNIIMA